jgi:hypothetical protein
MTEYKEECIYLGEYTARKIGAERWDYGEINLEPCGTRLVIYWDHYPNYMYYDVDEIEFKNGETVEKLKKRLLIKGILE